MFNRKKTAISNDNCLHIRVLPSSLVLFYTSLIALVGSSFAALQAGIIQAIVTITTPRMKAKILLATDETG
ncbi:MAG: hypothetical protein ACLFPF_02695 [Halanaerobiales bacterium]